MKYTLELSPKVNCQYTLVRSSRAKYLRIKVSPEGNVSIVLPKRCKTQLAHDFILQRKDWVRKCLHTIAQQTPIEITAPTKLSLLLIDEYWTITYKATHHAGITLIPSSSDKSLLLEGNTDNLSLVFGVLEKWLKNRAKQVFPTQLNSLSAKCKLPYNRLTIRGQKTRWGSCSAKKNISLNYKLLFFPKEVTHYVFIHELCHTIEMNHSQRFWNLVEKFDPNYSQHRLTLKDVSRFIPVGL